MLCDRVSYSVSSLDDVVQWFYDDYDEDSLEAGEEYEELLDLNFELIAKK